MVLVCIARLGVVFVVVFVVVVIVFFIPIPYSRWPPSTILKNGILTDCSDNLICRYGFLFWHAETNSVVVFAN